MINYNLNQLQSLFIKLKIKFKKKNRKELEKRMI